MGGLGALLVFCQLIVRSGKLPSGTLDILDVKFYHPTMSGISFVVDDRGRKKAVMIDLDQHSNVWEDLHDLLE